jgi:hypothetical protein
VTPDVRSCRRLTGFFNIDRERGLQFNCGGRLPTPVDFTTDGCTVHGVCDLAGNSDEFVHPGPVRWTLEDNTGSGREAWVARLPGPVRNRDGSESSAKSCEYLSQRDPFGLRSGFMTDCATPANQDLDVRESTVPRESALLVVRGGNHKDSHPVLYQTRGRYPLLEQDYPRGFRCAFSDPR